MVKNLKVPQMDVSWFGTVSDIGESLKELKNGTNTSVTEEKNLVEGQTMIFHKNVNDDKIPSRVLDSINVTSFIL